MAKKQKKLREVYFEIPFEFFLANDAEDFNDFMEWYLESKTKIDPRATNYIWKLKTTRYAKSDGILDEFFKEWYDMPYISAYDDDEYQPILEFEINFLEEIEGE